MRNRFCRMFLRHEAARLYRWWLEQGEGQLC